MEALRLENLTPYKICLCLLIQTVLHNKKNVVAHKFFALLRWLLSEIQEAASHQEPSLTELVNTLEEMPDVGPVVAKLLLDQLRCMRDPDALFTLFDDLQQLVHQPGDPADDDSKVRRGARVLLRRNSLGQNPRGVVLWCPSSVSRACPSSAVGCRWIVPASLVCFCASACSRSKAACLPRKAASTATWSVSKQTTPISAAPSRSASFAP
jgi:hypothetical protein